MGMGAHDAAGAVRRDSLVTNGTLDGTPEVVSAYRKTVCWKGDGGRFLGINQRSSPTITLGIYAHATLDMPDRAESVMDKLVSPVPVAF